MLIGQWVVWSLSEKSSYIESFYFFIFFMFSPTRPYFARASRLFNRGCFFFLNRKVSSGSVILLQNLRLEPADDSTSANKKYIYIYNFFFLFQDGWEFILLKDKFFLISGVGLHQELC